MSSKGIKTLVVDAGSSKTAWGIAGGGNVVVTKGVNALTVTDSELVEIIGEASSALTANGINAIYWYGAGCATSDACNRIKSALQLKFASQFISVDSDLVGAARALFGNGSGIASILGTGSNSGYFDGGKISFQVPSLGYILGDEGSGAAIGKRLIVKALRGNLAKPLSEKLSVGQGVNLANVLERVYRQQAPNSYLASFVPFLAENEDDECVKDLILEEFTCFAEKIIKVYPQMSEATLGFVGSVAWRFRELLEKALSVYNLRAHKIIKDPMEGLLKYHA